MKEFLPENKRAVKTRRKPKPKPVKTCIICKKLYRLKENDDFQKCRPCRIKEEGLEVVKKRESRTPKFTRRTCKVCKKKYVHTYQGFDAIMEREALRRKCDDCKKNHCIKKGPKPRPVPHFVECDICGERFSRKILVYAHMDKHRAPEEITCRVCHAKFSRRNTLRMHLRIHFESHVCEQCGFKTASRILLKKHLQTHEDISSNIEQEISTLTAARKRKPRTPPAQGNFPCSYCGLVFKTKGSLFGHEKRQHTDGTNRFTCKYCNAVLYRQKEFRMHVLSHSHKPLLFCHFPNCDIYYDSLKLLNGHIRMTHKSADEYVNCEKCNKQFKHKMSLAKHLMNNRCVPLSMRKKSSKMYVSKFERMHQNMTPEQLEMAAKIAKEQYLEIRGLSKIIEKEPDDEEDVFQENKLELESVIPKSEPLMSDDDDNSRTDCFIRNENDEDIKIDSLVEIEIKTEPIDEDQEMINESIENSDALTNMFTSTKTEPIGDYLKPVVLLERLNLEDLLKWIKVKEDSSFEESRDEDFNSFLELPVESKNKSNKRNYDDTLEKKTRKYRKRNEVSYRCKFCSESFTRKSHLNDHEKRFHTKDLSLIDPSQKYTCDLCGKDYISLACVRAHISVVHTTNVFYCPLCPSKFKTKTFLRRHVSHVHEKIKIFSCTFCGKGFKRKTDVQNHERRHGDPVTCHLCGKLVKVLDAHIKTVHSEKRKEVELLPCSFCGKIFNKYALKAHINNIHRKLHIATTFDRPCLKCGMKFPRRADLTKHDILTHFDGIIKYCTYEGCDKMFKTIKRLNLHIKWTHVRTGDFKCELCEKTYKSLLGLKKHLGKHNQQ